MKMSDPDAPLVPMSVRHAVTLRLNKISNVRSSLARIILKVVLPALAVAGAGIAMALLVP